ncbi:hypothetical protein Thiosp_01227 [Thiorhodovibrio litoralis]|nr:hypothetical protein Thiosp_01227 [Thiorhodovibrio litoralis]
MERLTLEAPAPLTGTHRTDAFSSGVPALDEWLTRRAALPSNAPGLQAGFLVFADCLFTLYP